VPSSAQALNNFHQHHYFMVWPTIIQHLRQPFKMQSRKMARNGTIKSSKTYANDNITYLYITVNYNPHIINYSKTRSTMNKTNRKTKTHNTTEQRQQQTNAKQKNEIQGFRDAALGAVVILLRLPSIGGN